MFFCGFSQIIRIIADPCSPAQPGPTSAPLGASAWRPAEGTLPGDHTGCQATYLCNVLAELFRKLGGHTYFSFLCGQAR